MDEYKLQDIWKKNLREFNDVMRLDSIIIRAMQEAIKEAQTEQLVLSGVSQRSELLSCDNGCDWQLKGIQSNDYLECSRCGKRKADNYS